METRKRPIQVRPRKGSALDRKQDETANDMADVLHSWADFFERYGAKSDEEITDD